MDQDTPVAGHDVSREEIYQEPPGLLNTSKSASKLGDHEVCPAGCILIRELPEKRLVNMSPMISPPMDPQSKFTTIRAFC